MGMCYEKIPQRTEVQETEQRNWMFCKIYKENQKELEKMYNFSCLCKLWNLIYSLNKQGNIFINHQKKLLSLEPSPLSSSFYNTTLGLFGLDGYVLLI